MQILNHIATTFCFMFFKKLIYIVPRRTQKLNFISETRKDAVFKNCSVLNLQRNLTSPDNLKCTNFIQK